MASRIMHYLIADLISKEIYISNFSRFGFGAFAPDLASFSSEDSHKNGIHADAHFSCNNHDKGLRGVNWVFFLDKYRYIILDDDFVLGYYIHLITDAYWLKNIQAKYMYIYPMEERNIMVIKGYKDMEKSNELLIRKYKISNKLELIDNVLVDEADMRYSDKLLSEFKNDFMIEGTTDKTLKVYNYEAIISFIESCVQKCIIEINALRSGNTPGTGRTRRVYDIVKYVKMVCGGYCVQLYITKYFPTLCTFTRFGEMTCGSREHRK